MTDFPAEAWPNGMPSLHIASVVLAYWQARPYGRWARIAAAVFLVGTLLATLGEGEHYLVDLVVAMPLSLTAYAACMSARVPYRRQRYAALFGGILLLAAWYALLFFGVELLLISPAIAWGISLCSTAAVVWLEWRLYRAIWDEGREAGGEGRESQLPHPSPLAPHPSPAPDRAATF